MPLLLDTARSGSASLELRGPRSITIGFVNNMPDAAIEATERQFVTLIRAAATETVIRLKLFAIPEMPRADHVREALAERYRDISELWDTRLDGVIVTGAEPRAASLKDEPYWQTLARLVDWARVNTASAVWSCLAAHAAVLHVDGVERQLLTEKRFGVFDCEVAAPHPLTKGVRPQPRIPHSRYNDLPEAALASSGYRIITRLDAAGADTFVAAEGSQSLFLYFQGHPEYEASTLLREYRRDIGRFLRGERERYPAMPHGFFDEEAAALASAFAARALRARGEELIADFPTSLLEARLENPWQDFAVGIYGNWVDYLVERRAERRAAALERRSRRRNWPNGARTVRDRSSAR